MKSSKRKPTCYVQGNPHKTQQIFQQKPYRIEWYDRVKVLKEKKNLPTKNILTCKLSFRINGEIKSSPDKQKLKKFITIKLVLQGMLKGLLEAEKKGHQLVITKHMKE